MSFRRLGGSEGLGLVACKDPLAVRAVAVNVWQDERPASRAATIFLIEFAKLVGERGFDANIINVGSSNCIQAEAKHTVNDACKGAVLMLTRSMAVDLAKQGIRSNAIGPGLIKTRQSDFGLRSTPYLAKFLSKQIPVGRIGEPEDVTGAALFLASDAARYITGQIIYVDAGIVA